MDYQIENVTSIRSGINEFISQGRRNHPIRALFEVDVTDARQAIRAYRRDTGKPLSFTAYLGSIFAKALANNPGTQKYQLGKKKAVVFESVDLSIVVEKNVGGVTSPSNVVVRGTESKELYEIEEIIQGAKKVEDDNALGEKKNPGQKFAKLPSFLRRFLLWIIFTRKPHLRRKIFGTAVLSSVGMFGHASGYGIPFTPYTTALLVGGLGKKPRFVGGEIMNREIQHITFTIHHDMADGAPMARMVHEMIAMIGKCHGLEKYAPSRTGKNNK